MTPEELTSRTAELFHQALDHPAAQRASFLKAECAGNDELYQRVSQLLEYGEVLTGDVLPNTKTEAPPILPDSVHEQYNEIEFLGRGGMGFVYRARDRELGTFVALKMLDPALASDEHMVNRLIREIQLGREIAHRNVCRTYALHRFEGTILIEMEYVEGQTLRSLLDRASGVSVPQGLKWAGEICEALAAIHERGIVHRDLKPANIMIDIDGHIKVMDFGIARSVKSDEFTSSTRIGTPGYMPPEQIEGKPLGPTADIYALGMVLLELFTGQRCSRCTLPPRSANPYLPRHIDRTIIQCLMQNGDDRFQSAREVIASLSAGLAPERVKSWPPWTWAAVLVPLVAAVLILVSLFVSYPPRPPLLGSRVNALAFTRDGSILASGSDDRMVRLWAMPKLTPVRTLPDHERAVQALAFSADGKWLSSASQDKTVKVWEVSSGRLAASFPGKVGVIAVALSPDSRWLASSAVRTVNLWDVAAKRKVHVLEHDDYVNALAFSPDGRFLASGSDDETAKVWNVETGQLVTELKHDDGVTCVAFSPDFKFVASGSFDKTVKIWSATSWRTLQVLSLEDEVVSLSFNSNGNVLMSVTASGRVELWEAPTWRKASGTMADEHGSTTAWAFSPDGRSLAVATREGHIRLQPLRR